MKINRITPDQHPFTQRLETIAKKPKELYYLGTLPKPDGLVVAIVGSRRPTAYGRDVTATIAGALARKGVVVVSGLALGIDAIAHTAVLENGGTAVAVLASGLDQITPRTNYQLGMRVIETGGALLSEYEPGVSPMQFRFLARNRIVSGLSDAIIVTEAGMRSGTLSTVARALEQGRTVFAVPGNITSPLSAGCNHLIRQGAIPLTSAEDVLEEFGIGQGSTQTTLLGDSQEENTILDLIKQGVQDGELLLKQSGLELALYNQTITMLEIKGNIRALGGNQWSL